MTRPRFAPNALVRAGTLLLLAFAAACGNFTAGGATGEARVLLSGDAPEPAPAVVTPSVPTDLARSQGPARQEEEEDDQPEGEVEAEFRMYLVREDGGLVALTDQEVRVRVDLEGVEEPEVANRVVEAEVYTGFRVVFSEIEAEVDAGLIINGEPVTGPIDVELEGPDLTVDVPVSINVPADDTVEILVDLNAADWLQAVDPVAGTVSAAAVASFIEVVVR